MSLVRNTPTAVLCSQRTRHESKRRPNQAAGCSHMFANHYLWGVEGP